MRKNALDGHGVNPAGFKKGPDLDLSRHPSSLSASILGLLCTIYAGEIMTFLAYYPFLTELRIIFGV